MKPVGYDWTQAFSQRAPKLEPSHAHRIRSLPRFGDAADLYDAAGGVSASDKGTSPSSPRETAPTKPHPLASLGCFFFYEIDIIETGFKRHVARLSSQHACYRSISTPFQLPSNAKGGCMDRRGAGVDRSESVAPPCKHACDVQGGSGGSVGDDEGIGRGKSLPVALRKESAFCFVCMFYMIAKGCYPFSLAAIRFCLSHPPPVSPMPDAHIRPSIYVPKMYLLVFQISLQICSFE